MPISIDITKSEIYQEGLAEGKQTGLAEGLEQGKQSGLAEGKRLAIEGFLRTGKLSEQDIADALGVTLEYVLAVKKEM